MPAMADRPHSDRFFATFLVVFFIFYVCLIYVLFPRHDAPSGSHASLSATLAVAAITPPRSAAAMT